MFEDLKVRSREMEVLEAGFKSEFWEVLDREFRKIGEAESKLALGLYRARKNDEGLNAASNASALNLILSSKMKFVRARESLFKKTTTDVYAKFRHLFKQTQGEANGVLNPANKKNG